MAYVPSPGTPVTGSVPAAEQVRRWWWHLAPHRQDRLAALAPLISVVLFLAAILASFAYLRLEEIAREREAVKRDVEYAQQRLRLRLLERQEQLMRITRDISNRELSLDEFRTRAETLVNQYPEMERLSWIDDRRRIRASYATASLQPQARQQLAEILEQSDTLDIYNLARELQQPVYSQRPAAGDLVPFLQLHIPLADKTRFAGVVLAEYSIDGLYRYGVPAEVASRYAVTLLDEKGARLAGTEIPPRNATTSLLPWAHEVNEYEVPVSPVGNGLVVRAQAYRASFGVVGSGLFWLVGVLAGMTTWMLIANWRHTRRRQQAQQALISETNFRRAMENSMATGMRALDLQGRITYVNAAFCQMTGWSEPELVGRSAPFPYWPETDHDTLMQLLDDELAGRVPTGGVQMRVRRPDNSLFDARLYVSPLIDARGTQTGWMTAMTDITEPNRIREQLSASFERFTTVLEALDASISVAPLGSDEMLFANKLYRLWFGAQTDGHRKLVAQAGMPDQAPIDESHDQVDSFAGMPTAVLPDSEPESAEVYLSELGLWLEVRTRYLSWVDGRLAQMVIATDITSRRLAEQQAAAQADRAQTASRLITMGEMASSVAHELNQPLTAINNYCNGMVSRLRAQQITQQDLLVALEKTARQAQRAGQIIQRIRSFVKRSEPNRTWSRVTDMIEEAVELAEIELRRRNVRLTRHVAPRLPLLLVDPILIEQVLINLLKNAAESVDAAQRATSQRKVELRVAMRQEQEQDVVEFSVLDSGQGLPPEVLDRLYEAFYTTKPEGMGIGLNLCRSIVESHQGRMRAENLYNAADLAGCCFSFWLPVGASRDAVASTQQSLLKTQDGA